MLDIGIAAPGGVGPPRYRCRLAQFCAFAGIVRVAEESPSACTAPTQRIAAAGERIIVVVLVVGGLLGLAPPRHCRTGGTHELGLATASAGAWRSSRASFASVGYATIASTPAPITSCPWLPLARQILRDPALSGHYVIELSRSGALDDLLVRVEARVTLEGEAAGQAGEELARRLKGMCGLSAEVEIAAPGGVERSMGKARRVVDKRPKG